MKKPCLIGLLSLCAAIAAKPVQAQQTDLLAYLAKTPPALAAFATEESSTYKNYVGVYVRAKVMRVFLQNFSDATAVHWQVDHNQYVASFRQQGQPCRALFGPKGTLILSLRTRTPKDLPRDVHRLLKTSYPGYAISAVTQVAFPDVSAWAVNLQDRNNLIVVQVTDGQVEELHRFKIHF